ncbi:acyl carrier protein [Nocardiopsis aegyptia]|uniref:Methoxymalonate biosynthesis acyl carrier protein n=1 Tax=Nocardiopsis aegyptia TaxID=220378 RepID=A0A7Z0EM09_9ACTN|nr:acyl carrier protein [Nocardiopsis aegyptia]NYJ33763.1 methoxymalonate biosynthesis acyl carrier protein [Nocardiopsis aegyptia]
MTTPAQTPRSQDLDRIESELIAFLEGRTRASWDEDVDLFATGGLSSMFAMELVVHLEQTYGVSIRGGDLKLDNFRTVRTMADLVRKLTADKDTDG